MIGYGLLKKKNLKSTSCFEGARSRQPARQACRAACLRATRSVVVKNLFWRFLSQFVPEENRSHAADGGSALEAIKSLTHISTRNGTTRAIQQAPLWTRGINPIYEFIAEQAKTSDRLTPSCHSGAVWRQHNYIFLVHRFVPLFPYHTDGLARRQRWILLWNANWSEWIELLLRHFLNY